MRSTVYLQKYLSLLSSPLNFLNTKDPTPSGVATRPACLSVCGGNSSWHTEGNMRGRTEGGSQPAHCPELRIQRDKIYGDTQWERNSPSRFKRLQMCAWPTATAHIWARKPPRTPPRPSSEPSMSRLCNAALRSALEKQLGRTHGWCKLLLTRQPLHQLCVSWEAWKDHYLGGWEERFGRGKVWGISDGRDGASM